MSEQVDNVVIDSANEGSSNAALESNSENFFAAMDRQVNPSVYDDEAPTQEVTTIKDSAPVEVEEVAEYDVLKKRYGDSSREAKRLNQRVSELEPYAPILDAMREDPNLITHVRNYFKGASGESPQSVKEELGLSDDFVFDSDEAISNPESDSAAVLQKTVDGVVQRRLSAYAASQKAENQKMSTEADFRSKHDLSDEEFREVVEFARNKSLKLDDVYYLMNREKKEQKIADSAREEVLGQMKKVKSRPKSAAHFGSQGVETHPDNDIFDAILGIDSDLENAFG